MKKNENNPIKNETINKSLSAMDTMPPERDPMELTSAVVHKIGDEFGSVGSQDFTNPDAKEVNGDTLFAEASIGKIRYAGLAYMLEQDKKLGNDGMETNAKVLFSEEGFKNFLNAKYGTTHKTEEGKEDIGTTMQKQILASFTGGKKDEQAEKGSEHATLADLATHFAGVGGITGDNFVQFRTMGLEYDYDAPTLLTQPKNPVVPREAGTNKPHFDQKPGMPKAIYGAHEYSNLGYTLLAEAMEYAYFKATGEMKDYRQLTDEYMLHPTQGKASGSGLSFDSTKFPDKKGVPENLKLSGSENLYTATYLDYKENKTDTPNMLKNPLVDVNKFNGANAAGGIFTSANDAAKFYGEFFKGFPGTKEYGSKNINDANHFFSNETIVKMEQEWKKRPADPNTVDAKKKYNGSYQGPGFVVRVKDGKITQYDKSGGTLGGESFLTFIPNEKGNTVDIWMAARENLTVNFANALNVPWQTLVNAYQKEGTFDRAAMVNDYKENGLAALKNKVNSLSQNKEGKVSGHPLQNELNDVIENLKNQGVGKIEEVNNISKTATSNTKPPSKNEGMDRN